MNPEGERIKHRSARLKPGAFEVVRQGVETGIITLLTGRQQLVLRGRYFSGADSPPTQEQLAAILYPDKKPRRTKHNISGMERAGFKRLEALLGQR